MTDKSLYNNLYNTLSLEAHPSGVTHKVSVIYVLTWILFIVLMYLEFGIIASYATTLILFAAMSSYICYTSETSEEHPSYAVEHTSYAVEHPSYAVEPI